MNKKNLRAISSFTFGLTLVSNLFSLSTIRALAEEGNQQPAYEDGSKGGEDAKQINQTLGGVYAGVAAVCCAACAAKAGGDTLGTVCTVSGVGAGVADAVATQNYAGAMMSLVGNYQGISKLMEGGTKAAAGGAAAAGTSAAGGTAAKAGGEAAGKSSGGSKESCMAAAMAGMQSMMKFTTADQAGNAAEENKKIGETLKTPDPIDPRRLMPSGLPRAERDGPDLQFPGHGEDRSKPREGRDSKNNAIVQTPSSSGKLSFESANDDPDSMIQKALAADSSVPRAVGTKEFGKLFKDMTGVDFGQFVKNARNAKGGDRAKLVAGGMASGAGMDAANTETLTTHLTNYAQTLVGPGTEGSSYASSGGHGGPSTGGDPANEMADFFKTTLAGLSGGDKKAPQKGVSMLAFNDEPSRDPASSQTTVDRDGIGRGTESLFARVHRRYTLISQKW